MPHIIVETTADLPENAHVPDILEALVTRLSQFESIDSKFVKAYHTLRSNWHMGDGAPAGIAHVTIALLAGRSSDEKASIVEGIWQVLQAQFAESLANQEVALSLELRDMDPATYRKII